MEIKFRLKDLVKTMSRLDGRYIAIQESLKKPGLSPDERQKLESELKERQELLAPIYHQVGHAHCNTHLLSNRLQLNLQICMILLVE